MARFLYPEFSSFIRKNSGFFLALSFLLGVAAGLFLFHYTGDTMLPLMCTAYSGRISIVDLLIPFLLPFSFSAFAVYFSSPRALYVICFFKTALYFFLSCAVTCSFGGAGWMIRLLFLFSDICFLVLLYWYWMRHISGDRMFSIGECVAFLGAAGLVSGVDYFMITPILRDVLGI